MLSPTGGAAAARPGSRSANERAVLAALRVHDRLSRTELARLSGLPKTTVTGVVGRLLRLGVVVEHAGNGDGQGRAGRPAAGLALAGPAGRVAVFSLTHVWLRLAVAGFDGTVLARRDMPIDRPRDARRVLDAGVALLDELLTEADLSRQAITCAVVGVPAPYDRGTGVVVGRIPGAVMDAVPEIQEVLGWLRPDPAPEVAGRLGVPTVADNDANLGALGEATFGAGRGLGSLIYLKVVEGLGAGLILDGRLYRGARGLAGEFAHIQVSEDGLWCSCGGRGCLGDELGATVAGLRPAYQRPVTFTDVMRLAVLGDAGTLRIMNDAGRRIGRVLADACMVLSPDAVVVDGLLGAAGKPFLAGVREMIDRHTMTTVAETVRLVAGSLGDEAEILGAVALARSERLDEVLGGAGSLRR
jgi:predicted NBD/HSP70 family sugar kinase